MTAVANLMEEAERVTKGAPLAPLISGGVFPKDFALIGVQGIVRMAMAGFDIAAWDALAIAAGLPLARLPAVRQGLSPPIIRADLAYEIARCGGG